MTVLLPKSMKSKQEVLQNNFFFLVAHAVSSEMIITSSLQHVVRTACLFGDVNLKRYLIPK